MSLLSPLYLAPLSLGPLHRGASMARNTMMIVFPHGGQAAARRNAWAGMSRDAAAVRARAEAEAVLQASVSRHVPVEQPALSLPPALEGTGR